jgi:hypothetical protein
MQFMHFSSWAVIVQGVGALGCERQRSHWNRKVSTRKEIGVKRTNRAFESLEGFASNVFRIIDDPRDSLNRMRRRFVIVKRGGRANLRTFGSHVRRTSSGSHNRIIGFNRVNGFYSFPLSRASGNGFRRSFGRRKGDSSVGNVSGQ